MNTLRQRVPFFMNYASGYLDTVTGTDIITLPKAKLNGLKYVKLFGGTEQRNLPTEYTQVEYLESSGTQYIDTGIVLKSEATITMVGQNVQSSVVSGPYSFWGFIDDSTLPRWGWSIYQNRWLADLNATSQVSGTADTQKHTFINTCYYQNDDLKYRSLLDGNSITYNNVENPAAYTSNTLSAYLFARNNDGTAGNFLSCRIFSYEIVQDGVKVLSLVPCKRNSDSVLGMYDTVSGTFFTNAGTGSFTAGADVTAPSPDTPMDIVSNNGVLKLSPNVITGNWILNYSRTSATGILYDLPGAVASDIFPVQSNTTYVACYNGVANVARWYEYDANKSYIINSYVADSTTLTTSSNTKYIAISFSGSQLSGVVSQEKYKKISVNEGSTALPYMPYGQIYADGTVETVEVHSNNLFDITALTRNAGYMVSTVNGNFSTSDQYTRSDYIPVLPNTQYIRTTSGAASTVYFDINKNFLLSRTGTSFTTPANCYYVMYNVKNDVDYSQGMMVKGDELPTTYSPYFNGGTATAEMLLAVGDYQDVQSVLDGEVTRKVGIKVLDGTEDFGESGTIGDDTHRFSLSINTTTDATSSLCTHISKIVQNNATSQSDRPCIRFSVTGSSIQVYTTDNTTTLTQFKQWLTDQYKAGTPVIVVYPLATAATETVTGQPLSIQSGTNIIEITQASMNGLELEAKYKRSK